MLQKHRAYVVLFVGVAVCLKVLPHFARLYCTVPDNYCHIQSTPNSFHLFYHALHCTYLHSLGIKVDIPTQDSLAVSPPQPLQGTIVNIRGMMNTSLTLTIHGLTLKCSIFACSWLRKPTKSLTEINISFADLP